MADTKKDKKSEANPKSSSGFTLFKQKEKTEPDPEIIQLHHEFNSLSRRIREQEDRLQNIRKKSLMMDSSMLSQNKKFKQEIKQVNSDTEELKHMIDNLDNKLLLLIKELRMCARKEDVKVLQKYINIWEPINFVTRNEVERIVRDTTEEIFEEFKKKMHHPQHNKEKHQQ